MEWTGILAKSVLGGTCLLLATLVAASSDRPDTLVLGRISDDPQADVARLKPLLDVVVPKLAAAGIARGEILLARDPVQMRNYLRRGRVDWVTETAAMAAMLGADAQAKPFVRAMRENEGAYHSVFFVRRDSGIETLNQLPGKLLALQSRSSTSAFYLPLLMLKQQGLTLVELASPDDVPKSDQVGFALARTELNIAAWVEKGLVDVGAFSNTDWDNPEHMPESFRTHMRVIARTADVPRAVELVRADFPEAMQQALTQVLLGLGEDASADSALRKYFGTTRFIALDSEHRRTLEQLGQAVLTLRREVE